MKAPYEIVLTPVDSGWTWVVRVYGESTLARGRAGNLCVAAMEAANAIDREKSQPRKATR